MTMPTMQADQIAELKNGFGGDILLSTDPGYDDARRIWNAMIDKRPALIARCTTTTDVVRAVAFARDQRLPLAVRGGGHNIAGSAVCDDGVVVDLSRMRAVHVDAKARRVIVEGGALLSDLDEATQAHGLATPIGINSTTGIAGLTLGGGFGWLSRKYGMTVDNLESAEVVTASGEVLRASAVENADLFWALRGGSGNFGVVTRFEFRLHPVGPELLSGLIVYPASEASSVLKRYRDLVAQSPGDLTVWAVLRQAPPLPFLPASVHGQPVVVLALLYAGDPTKGTSLVEPFRRLGTPLGEHIGVQPYRAWQQAFDPLLAPGARNYWKSHNLTTLADGLIDVVGAFLERLPTPQCEIFIASLGGATEGPAETDTAYAHRDARFVMNVHARWDVAADDARCIAWAREFFAAGAPFATGGVYVNFLTADEGDRVSAAYGSSYRRLSEIKRRYDPDNLFHTNQNVAPAGRAS
jgi:FAD/FMN-containing dehydrogenase